MSANGENPQMRARIHAHGDAWPKAGDLVSIDGEPYEIESIESNVHTDIMNADGIAVRAALGNYCYAEVAESDWLDWEDDVEPFACHAVLEES